ncbi:MAG: hypothetical protein U0271_47660 [Polyangiaceae bacterium]
MKFKILVVDLELSRTQKTLAALGLSVASVAVISSIAMAQAQHVFTSGQLLTAKDLNENFADFDTRVSALDTRVTTLEAAPAPLTTLTKLTVSDGETYKAECMTNSGTFSQGACARMAQIHCIAQGYQAGWFEGDLAAPGFTDPAVICVK